MARQLVVLTLALVATTACGLTLPQKRIQAEAQRSKEIDDAKRNETQHSAFLDWSYKLMHLFSRDHPVAAVEDAATKEAKSAPVDESKQEPVDAGEKVAAAMGANPEPDAAESAPGAEEAAIESQQEPAVAAEEVAAAVGAKPAPVAAELAPAPAAEAATEPVAAAGCGQCLMFGAAHVLPFGTYHKRFLKHPQRESKFRRDSWKQDGLTIKEEGIYWLMKTSSVSIQGRYKMIHNPKASVSLVEIAVGGSMLDDNKLIVEPTDGQVTWNGETILASDQSYTNEYIKVRNFQRSEHIETGGRAPSVDFMLPNGVFMSVNRWARSLALKITACEAQVGVSEDSHCGGHHELSSHAPLPLPSEESIF